VNCIGSGYKIRGELDLIGAWDTDFLIAGAKPGVTTPSAAATIYYIEPAQDPSPSEPLQFERPRQSVNERQEIAIRLAAFRATQAWFQREREAYSVGLLNKVRAGTPR
jgi:hypothetical protein